MDGSSSLPKAITAILAPIRTVHLQSNGRNNSALHELTYKHLLHLLVEFGGTVFNRPALAKLVYGELNKNKVLFNESGETVTCEEKKCNYLYKMIDHQARKLKKVKEAAEANCNDLLQMHPSSRVPPPPPPPPPPPHHHNPPMMLFHPQPHRQQSPMVHHHHHQMVSYQPQPTYSYSYQQQQQQPFIDNYYNHHYGSITSGGYVNNDGENGASTDLGICSFCMSTMINPVVLHCRHVLCYGCVMRLQHTVGMREAAVCPLCSGDNVGDQLFVQRMLEG